MMHDSQLYEAEPNQPVSLLVCRHDGTVELSLGHDGQILTRHLTADQAAALGTWLAEAATQLATATEQTQDFDLSHHN